jgi:hypothetical protein
VKRKRFSVEQIVGVLKQELREGTASSVVNLLRFGELVVPFEEAV